MEARPTPGTHLTAVLASDMLARMEQQIEGLKQLRLRFRRFHLVDDVAWCDEQMERLATRHQQLAGELAASQPHP